MPNQTLPVIGEKAQKKLLIALSVYLTSLLAANMLEGDEKTVFREIIDNNEILQRELILKTGFSEPKVSRLLDKLERRGLILRQRNGMGNRILLKNRQ